MKSLKMMKENFLSFCAQTSLHGWQYMAWEEGKEGFWPSKLNQKRYFEFYSYQKGKNDKKYSLFQIIWQSSPFQYSLGSIRNLLVVRSSRFFFMIYLTRFQANFLVWNSLYSNWLGSDLPLQQHHRVLELHCCYHSWYNDYSSHRGSLSFSSCLQYQSGGEEYVKWINWLIFQVRKSFFAELGIFDDEKLIHQVYHDFIENDFKENFSKTFELL